MLVYTALTQFAWTWSDFILPKMLLKNKNLWTVAINASAGEEDTFGHYDTDFLKPGDERAVWIVLERKEN